MINLLPPEAAKQLQASRHNNILLRYLVGMIITLGLIVMVYLGFYLMMKSTERDSTSQSQENRQKIAYFKNTKTNAKAYTDNLKIAKAIFGSEYSYPNALAKIAAALPAGTVLESLDLNPTMTGQPITLTVAAKTKEQALSVKESFETAKIATGITISSLQEQSANPAPGQPAVSQDYPVQISLNLTFDKAIFTAGDNK